MADVCFLRTRNEPDVPPFRMDEASGDWNDFAVSRDRETFMRDLCSGFAIAQRQALTKEAEPERLALQRTEASASLTARGAWNPARCVELVLHGSEPGARVGLGGPRQCLRVDILPDIR
jgi:hypothetical protein